MIFSPPVFFGLILWLFDVTPFAVQNDYGGRPVYLQSCVHFSVDTDGRTTKGFAEFPIHSRDFAHGMKHRTKVGDNEFMIFDMGGQQYPAFWMQDTPTSLDIAFFDVSGMLVHLAPSTTPFSERLISPASASPISYVMEMRAGISEDFDLEVGATRLLVAPPTSCLDPPKG